MSQQIVYAQRRVVLAACLLFLGALAAAGLPKADAAVERVLILSTTVTGGASSLEAVAASSRGYGVDVVSPSTWSSMTAADFAGYRALVLGDPTCQGLPAAAAAAGNAHVWGPVVDGNVVVNGTDPVYHAGQGGAALTDKSMAFALDAPGKTGAYLSLSCYYHGTAPGTAVPLLSGLSTAGPAFTARGVGCFNDAHIVATHPALSGLTDAHLSGWSCSVHEAFSTWPSDFTVLAIAKGIGGSYTAPDGTTGTPYILARGEGLSASSISLTPGTSTVALPGTQTLSALISVGGAPQSGEAVSFAVLSGPHAGSTGTGTTDAAGKAPFTLTGTTPGTDVVRASFVDSRGVTQQSNTASITWTAPPNAAPEADAGPDTSVPEGGSVGLTGSGTDADGDTLTTAWDLDGDSTFETAGPTATFSAAGLDGPSTATATFRACDASACDTDTTTVTITNVAPTVSAGPDVTVFRGQAAALTGTFTDPAAAKDEPYTWTFGSAGGSASHGDSLGSTVAYGAPGSYTQVLSVTDDDGATGSDSVTVHVVNRKPDCTRARASSASLWPPNHQMVAIDVLGVTDDDGDGLVTKITGIRQDEQVRSTGSGSTAPDGAGVGTGQAQVRAERDGSPRNPGDGRVYTITFTADDRFGGTCSGSVTVGVPHDQRGAAAVDGGPLYDSTV